MLSGKDLPLKGTCSCASLRRLTRRVTQHYDQVLKPSGLRVTQYSILSHIAAAEERAETLSLTQLARRLDMDRTTLTRNLGPLERAGWLDLMEGPDRRSRAVRLTPAGARLLRKTRPLWCEAELRFRQAVGADQAAQLRRLISGAMSSLSEEP